MWRFCTNVGGIWEVVVARLLQHVCLGISKSSMYFVVLSIRKVQFNNRSLSAATAADSSWATGIFVGCTSPCRECVCALLLPLKNVSSRVCKLLSGEMVSGWGFSEFSYLVAWSFITTTTKLLWGCYISHDITTYSLLRYTQVSCILTNLRGRAVQFCVASNNVNLQIL